MPLVPLNEARDHVLASCQVVEPVTVALAGALDRAAAEAVTADACVPPFDNSAMDGFAVRSADTVGAPVTLEVVGTLAAGQAPGVEVGPGQAVRIMTGAPVPAGADAVVMVERTVVSDEGRRVEVDGEVAGGTALRRAGDDLRPGDRVLAAGDVLTPGRLGVLASLGVAELAVFPRARVGVLSTGDELVEPPAPLRPGQIRDSNRPTLLALVAAAGCEAVDLGLVADDEAALTEAFHHGVATCDAVVTSGGVSMGDFDLVKVVLDRLGDMRWMQVAIKPAKPLAFGTVGRTPVFGLPGNPVSSMVSFELFARPALRRMMGFPAAVADRPAVPAVAGEALRRRPDGKTHFVRVIASMGDDGRYRVRSAGGQGSHQLRAMAAANALAVLADGEGAQVGDVVDAMLLGGGAVG
ncbi:MAG TPA: gephyrin-like molybdotransferase Glp [Acidimicrobiales bacterium]|nr:gephyrin-like molybdotransferase Glp [Acidimicrobiales bacterium]